MPGSRAQEHYELWLLGTDGRMVSLGTFKVGVDGEVDVALPLSVDPRRYLYLDVSVEPDDGDSRHSGRSVLRSRIPA
jgi:anti-sigma-K factor RskA